MMKTLKEKYDDKIYKGWGGGGGSYSPTYYYHPEKAYAEAHKVWNKEVLNVFQNYEKAIANLGKELEKTFERENLKFEMIITEELHKLRKKAIELENLEEETQEVTERKKWLEEIIQEINLILEI
ncbi:MAG: hypothetical protein ACRC5T_04115 [Cetobacterium sp.]